MNISDTHSSARTAPVANPGDHEGFWKERLFLLWAGACGPTSVYVWAHHYEDALEEAMDYWADHAPGVFTDIELPPNFDDLDDDEQNKAWDEATADLTLVSHTSYGGGMDAIPSWEWGATEVHDLTLYRAIALRSYYERIMSEEGSE